MIKIKKIVFFTTRYPFYTVGEDFFESELSGAAQGYDEVYVVCCDSNLENPEIKKKLPPNVTAVFAKAGNRRLNLIKACFMLPFTKLFWREIKQIRLEELPFISSFKTLVYAGATYLAIRRNFPFIKKSINLSNDDELTFMGYWLHYVSLAALRFRNYIKRPDARVFSRAHGSADVLNLTRPLRFYPFRQYLLDNLDGVLAISDKGRDFLKSLSSKPENISRVYIGSCGVDKYIERRREPFTIVSCSFLVALKRVEIIAKAVSILAKDYPDIRWIHFGDGPEMSTVLDACADIMDNAELRGFTPHDKVLEFFATGTASVFVSASASEGLPVSVMEALGYSLPIIATDVNATCEAVVNGVSGSLVTAKLTPEILAQHIREYIEMDKKEFDTLSKSAFNFWQKNFDCQKNSEILKQELNSF